MKTILFTSKFQKAKSKEYMESLDITPDETIEWDGKKSTLPKEYCISSLPCLVIDPEGAFEAVLIGKGTPEEKAVDVPLRVQKFEYRKNQTNIKTEKDKFAAREKK